ncbi:cytochrome-c peroxidase [Paracoccus aerodenitrificans]|uniref:cytochrome-c peroxidase n=1 Tax=Paracoccus aerodenitrificans TaxID=3017781 RepID=UPI0022F05033|nr:cytochrome-c peroxidase [Paracoccus aerodenitrificans]WBU64156.1 cytochrome-c peroxidase [Paracoccus aerodenitrificans]
MRLPTLLLMFGTIAFPVHAQETQILDPGELREEAASLFEPIPETPQPITAPDGSEAEALESAKIELGKKLFFDPRMSASQLISCQTCHNVGLGGVDQLPTSIGHGWQQGPRNAPTMLNAVFNIAQFWDGRAADLAEQAMGPLQASVEMNNTPERLLETLSSMPAYVEEFAAAFPESDEALSFENFATAIEQFEATLITPNSAFDRFLGGEDDVMTEQQLSGLRAFIDTGCVGCHYGMNFGGDSYHPFGVIERPGGSIMPEADKGRFAVTETADDEYVFRAAPLRNISLTAPYFHSGAVWDLAEAVQIMSSAQIGTELTDQQADDIVAFLGALTGDQPLIEHPILPPRSETTPEPISMIQ